MVERIWVYSVFSDITKEFKLSESGLATTFDVIHSEEVFEHLTEEEVVTTLRNIKSLMKDESILLLGISLHDDCREIRGGKSVNLHKTVRTGLWWESALVNNGFELMPTIIVDKNVYGWPFATSNRSNFSDSVFFGVKKASC